MSAFHDNALMGASGQQGYKISRSVRTRSSASAYLNRTPSVSGSASLWTWSGWVKRGSLGSNVALFSAAASASAGTSFRFINDTLDVYRYNGTAYNWRLVTTQLFRDPSAWYHIIIAFDSGQATASDRVKIYVNGTQVTAFSTASYPTTSYAEVNGSGYVHYVSRGYAASEYFDGYQTEINWIDGQALTPSSFGETDTITGVWKPKKYTGTYGTNGFYLNFSDNSATTATTIGKDYSGNGNNWTPNNISVTAGVTYDSMLDVPTNYDDGTVYDRGNYPVINPLNNSGGTTIADGNLKTTWGSASSRSVLNTMAIPDSGKFYAEFVVGTLTSASVAASFGLATASVSRTSDGYGASGAWVYYASNQSYISRNGTSSSQIGSNQTFAAGGIVQIAVDRTNNQAWLGYNNVWVNATNGTDGNPSAGTNPTVSSLPADLFIIIGLYANSGNVNFGQRPFTYTPPTGFVALNTQNLPAPTISNGAQYMAATTYTGTGSAQNISNAVNGVSFQPDLVWVKARSSAYSHRLANVITGATNYLDTAQTAAEFTDAGNSVSSFNSGGFGVGTYVSANNNGTTYVGWQWKAGGTAVSNTAGTITSSVSVGATQGFSVATFTAQTSGTGTFGHGLGVAPSMVIVKQRASAGSWGVYHISVGNGSRLLLDSTAASVVASSYWNNTSPTSTVVTLGSGFATAGTMVAYCFAEVAGYSKFGSYTGNGSADGTFVYCGFRPRFVMIKRTDSTGNWFIDDSSRVGYNVIQSDLLAEASNAEGNYNGGVDFLSNGFKLKATANGNASGGTFIFMAFAENPFRNSLAR